MEFIDRGAASFIHSGEEWKANTGSRSEMPVWTVSQKFSHLQWRRLSKELWCRPTTTADFGSPFRQIPFTSHICLLEGKIQDWGMYLFTISYGSYAKKWRHQEVELADSVDELRSSSSIRSIPMPNFLKYSMRGLLQHWTKSSIILPSKEESVWRNKRPRKRTVSFVAGRLLTWSTNTPGSLQPMILSRIKPTYSLLVFEMMIFRNSTQSGTEFYCLWRKSHLMTSWKDCTN